MDDEGATQGDEMLPCPVCSGMVKIERLVVEDEHGRDEVYIFDCLKEGNFHVAMTRTQLLEVAANVVVEQVRQAWLR